jgi:hypothetical protein
MNKDRVIDWIFLSSNIDELRDIKDAVRERISTLSSKIKYKISPGMTVKVDGSNKFTEGEVKKVNKTRAVLKVNINGNVEHYNVPFTMISI